MGQVGRVALLAALSALCVADNVYDNRESDATDYYYEVEDCEGCEGDYYYGEVSCVVPSTARCSRRTKLIYAL